MLNQPTLEVASIDCQLSHLWLAHFARLSPLYDKLTTKVVFHRSLFIASYIIQFCIAFIRIFLIVIRKYLSLLS